MAVKKASNDERIMELKQKIEDKKKGLKRKTTRFTPETNCMLELDGKTYNLNVCRENQLMLLLVKLNSMYSSFVEIKNTYQDKFPEGYEFKQPEINGYTLETWIDDIINKLSSLYTQSLQKKLTEQEKKLNELLSSDKRTELAIDEIESMLQ